MSLRLDIVWYRGVYDVPRLFSINVDGGYLLFDCVFDDISDGYPSVFSVTLVKSETELTADATVWAAETSQFLGNVKTG